MRKTVPTWELLLVAIPMALTLITFAQVARFDFILYDDPAYLYENPKVAAGLTLEGLQWALTETGETNLWHPLTWISLMFDVEVFGLEQPGLHHLANLGFHLVAVLTLYLILLHYFESPWIALILGSLWAIHPHRAENIAWLSQRKDVLCMSFMLASWLAWIKSDRSPRSFLTWLSLAFFLLSLLSKPSSVGFPLVLLASDLLLPKGQRRWSGILVLFFLSSVIAAVLALHFQGQGDLSGLNQANPLGARLLRLPFNFWWYVESSLLPQGILWVYAPDDAWSLYLRPLLGTVALCGLLFWFRRHRTLLLGAAITLAFWLPVSGLASVSFYQVAERYSYFIQLGFLMMLGSIAKAVMSSPSAQRLARPLAVAGFCLMFVSTAFAYQRTSHWQSSAVLFQHEAEHNPRSLLAQIFLGILEKQQGHWKQAIPHFQRALQLDSESGLAATHLGDCYRELEQLDLAETSYRKATTARILDSPAPFQSLATLLHEQGDLLETERILREGLQRFPHEPIVHLDLGSLMLRDKKAFQEAEFHYRQVIRLAPQILEAKLGLALSLRGQGDEKEARRLINELRNEAPDRFGRLPLP
ncbi:MAG: tetratricopeptide repeat protein [Verrucomicrobiota bacterium JB023]|nr:tetratricopeptide repeat protein [Verrucomicrobiota bacterium JB023]